MALFIKKLKQRDNLIPNVIVLSLSFLLTAVVIWVYVTSVEQINYWVITQLVIICLGFSSVCSTAYFGIRNAKNSR
jgi:Flp pilus assembly protein protease CpaA